MDIRQFARQLQVARIGASALNERANSAAEPEDSRGLVLEAIEELHTSLEELQVAQEELQQQNDELMASRQTLEAERQRYQDLFELAPDGYLVTDTLGVIREANEAAVSLLDVSRDLLIGKPLAVFLLENDRRTLRVCLNRLAKGDIRGQIEVRLRGHLTRRLYADLRVVMVRDPVDGATTLRWLVRDVTARREAEDRASALNAELEQRVAGRTAELESAIAARDQALIQEQMARSESESRLLLLEQLQEGMREYVNITSHDLRAPLTAIVGHAQLISRSRELPKPLQKSAEQIFVSARRMNAMIQELMEAAQLETGQIVLKKGLVDLAELARGLQEQLRETVNDGRVALVAPDRLPPVLGDANRLERALMNLIGNALKYSPPGSQVTVLLRAEGDRVLTSVIDRGVGIAPDELAAIFDRYRRTAGAAESGREGLGMGLYITRGLVEAHGGSIWVESEPGRGSIFTFSLPAASAD